METSEPRIYQLSHNRSQLQFSVGGFVANGAQVQVSTNLADWQTAQIFAATTNQIIFTTSMDQPMPRFFRVQ